MRIIRNENDLADLAKICRIVWRQFIEAQGGPYGQTPLDVLAERIPDARREDIEAALELIDRRDRERAAQAEELAEERQRAEHEREIEENKLQFEIRLAQVRSEGYAEGR